MARQEGYSVDEARRLFASVADKFGLSYTDNEWSNDLDSLDFQFRPQPGLLFAFTLSFQNRDELHLQTDDFCGSYFPCTDPKIRMQFEEAVGGLLSGEWRIISRKRSWGMLNAELQQPSPEGAWLDVYKYARCGLPFGRVTTTVTQNRFS